MGKFTENLNVGKRVRPPEVQRLVQECFWYGGVKFVNSKFHYQWESRDSSATRMFFKQKNNNNNNNKK